MDQVFLPSENIGKADWYSLKYIDLLPLNMPTSIGIEQSIIAFSGRFLTLSVISSINSATTSMWNLHGGVLSPLVLSMAYKTVVYADYVHVAVSY